MKVYGYGLLRHNWTQLHAVVDTREISIVLEAINILLDDATR